MKYGLVGEKLGHSFSGEIHRMLGDYEYSITEIERENFDSFIKVGDFAGINVTIPYKETIIPHLYYMDDAAEEIGSVNTVINTEGHLFGFNTDLDGMIGMIERAGISLTGKKVAILGTGGTSKTAYVAAKRLGASKIIKVSRTPSSPSVSYDELYSDHVDTEIIINTTPVGMYPMCDSSPVDLKRFKKLSGVVDVIYNPLRTPLIVEAMNLGIPATGGLYMLVRQGVRASEIFLDTKYEDNISEVIYKKILNAKENIALIGMPSSGKTTVGKLLADLIGFKLVDTDEEIVKRCKMDIPSIFKSYGEDYFRELEENVVKEVSRES
jgi:shikimate dehydrogenase